MIVQAFPSISTGIYGYPIKDATHVALIEVRKYLGTREGDKVCLVSFCDGATIDDLSYQQFDRVVFVVFSDTDREVYE